jgi:hypothetical protein
LSTDEIVGTVLRLGGALKLEGDNVRCSLPPAAAHLANELRKHKLEIVTLLRLRNSWPTPLSYPEYLCRLRAAGLVPCSREEWEVDHGSDAERMAKYERLCRRGSAGAPAGASDGSCGRRNRT